MSLTGDTFDFQQGNVVTSSAQIVDPGATAGDVLTVQADRSIAAAPGGGSLPDPFFVEGTDPSRELAEFRGPVGQANTLLELDIDDGAGGDHSIFTVAPPGGSGIQYSPNPGNDTSFQFRDNGDIQFSDEDGDDYLVYNSQASVKNLDLDPANGQVSVLAGVLRLASYGEPADNLFFNGSFAFYFDSGTLKVKCKLGGDILHLTLGTPS